MVLDDFLFLVVLIIPGFLVVETGRYLSGIAETSHQLDTAKLVLLWSFIIDTIVVLISPLILRRQIIGLEGLRQELFGLNSRLVFLWLVTPLIFGILYASGLHRQYPSQLRKSLQSRISAPDNVISTGSESTWRTFFRDNEYVAAITKSYTDGKTIEKIYLGQSVGYSTSKDKKELRLYAPFVWSNDDWVPIHPNTEDGNIPIKGSEILIPEESIITVLSAPPGFRPESNVGTDLSSESKNHPTIRKKLSSFLNTYR